MYQTQFQQKIERAIDGRRGRVEPVLCQLRQQLVGTGRFVVRPYQLKHTAPYRGQPGTAFFTEATCCGHSSIDAVAMIMGMGHKLTLGYNVAILRQITPVTIMKFLKTAVLVIFTTLSFNLWAATEKKVLASVHPLALVAASVVNSDRLQTLLPAGTSPHDFALRPSDVDRLQEADVILWTGPVAEPYLSGFARRWPDKTWIDLSKLATPEQPRDPHYWLSVPVVLKAQAALADALGKDASGFARQVERAVLYSDQVLAPVKDRGFFVFHRA